MRSSVPGMRVRRAENSAQCVETRGAWPASGVPLQQYTCSGTPTQARSLIRK